MTMSLDACTAAVKALFASGTPAAHDVTDGLSDLLAAVRAADGATLKAGQRDAEDSALLVVLQPPGGGPPQRALAAQILCSLFTRGNSIAMFARVSELTALLTAKGVTKAQPAAVRLGALHTLTALTRAVGPQLAGSYGRLITDVCPIHLGGEATVRCGALDLLAAAVEQMPSLTLAAQESALKCARTGAGDKIAAVRSAAMTVLRALAVGADGAGLYLGDRGAKGEVVLECVALSQAGIKGMDKGERDAAAAALGALAAAAQLPPATAALGMAAKPEARKALAKALSDPVGEWVGASFVLAKSRPVRQAAADAWVAMLAATARRVEDSTVVASGATAVLALKALAVNTQRVNAGDEDLHAAACALYILRAGAARFLPEAGQRSLLAALTAHLAGADGGSESAPPPLMVATALRGITDTLARLGEVPAEVATATEASLRRCLVGGATADVRVEAALALRALALAYPPCVSALLRAGLAGVRGVDPGLVEGPLAIALHGHTCLTAAVLACAPSLPLGLPAELPRATAEAAMQLLDARSPLVKSCGWTLLAAALAGPGGPADAETHGSTLLLMWNIAFEKAGVLAPPKRAGQPSELRTKGVAGATEMLWRVAAAEALDAFLRTAVCMGDRAAAGAVASLVPTLKAALTLAADPALGDAAGPHGSYERTACSLFKLRVLEALQALPDAGVYAAVHPEAVALAKGCLDAGALPARQLLLLLLHPGDAALGPVPPGGDALQDALRVFEGAYDAAPPKLWVPITLSERGSELGGQQPPQVQQAHPGGVGPFPSPMPVAMALAEVQVIECGRLIAATTTAGTPLGLLPQLSVAAKAGYPVSRDLAAKAPAVSVLGTRAPSSSLRSEAAAGGSPQLTNAAAVGMAALTALGPRPCAQEDAYELDVLACTLLGDPAPGAAHVRAAAELRGGAVRLTRTPEAAATTVNEVIRQLRESSSPTARAALALCVGALFRAVGGMAMTTSVAQAHEALAQVAAQPDSSAGSGGGGAEAPRTHVWAAHALYLVAAAAGAGYLRHAPATLALAHELLSNDAAVQAPQLVASAGRLVNAAVSALGPELQPGGRTLTRCVTLIEHVRASCGDDPGAQLQQLLFLQACALFAPRALPPAVVAPQLRDALQSRQPPVRAAAAAVAHNLSETNAAGMLPEAMEGPLFGLLDYEWDAPAVADARGALEALLRADAPEQPVRWLQLTGAIACADFTARAADAAKAGGGGATRGGGGDDNEEDADAAVASATAAAATLSVSGASLAASAPLPSWRTRTLAAEFMCRLPDSVGSSVEHTDLVAARAVEGQWLIQHQAQAVDLGYRVATGPATSLRPWGLVLLRRLLAKCGHAVDPDVPGGGALLMEQDIAQLLSSLRAALAPTALPPAWAQGAALAAELLSSGLVARDAAVQQRLVALLASTTSAVGLQPSATGRADGAVSRTAPTAGPEALAFGEWAVGCAKAALLTAHARLVLAVPNLAPLRAAHTKAAPQLNAGWLALLHDTATAVGLAPPGDAGGVLPLKQVPIAQHVVARAHLADAWRPVLAAVVAGAYPEGGSLPAHDGGLPGGLALSSEQHTMLLSLACWALTRPAALFMRDASRPHGNGPCGVWGLCAGFLPGEPHPAACGAAALRQLLAPCFLVAPDSDGAVAGVSLSTVADVVAAVSEAACSRVAHPALEVAAPGLVAAILEALPPGFLVFALDEDAGEEVMEAAYTAHCASLEALGSGCLALAGQALQRALTSDQPEMHGAAVEALGAVATLFAALAADEQAEASDAVAALPGAALDVAVQAFQVPGLASSSVSAAVVSMVTAAAAAGVVPAQLDSAAEALASCCLDCADAPEAAPSLAPLLDAIMALCAAPGARSATRKRCREAVTILLDEEAACPLCVQHQALAALLRAFSSAAMAPAGSRVRKNAASMLSSMGPTVSAAVGAAIASSGEDEDAAGAASDGIKALAAALALADTDAEKVGVLNLLVPLLISAAAPEDGEAHSPALQSMAMTLITRTAAAMAVPFKAVVAEQPVDSRERLQAALRHTNGHAPAAPMHIPAPSAPATAKASLQPPALDVSAFKKAAAKAPPASFDSFDAFEADEQKPGEEQDEEPEADDSEEGF